MMKQVNITPQTKFLLEALAAGAAGAMRPNQPDRIESEQAITAAYAVLKEKLEEGYPQVDADLLDIGPGSPERRNKIAAQLQEAGAADDGEIVHLAQVLLDRVNEADPELRWAAGIAETPPQLED